VRPTALVVLALCLGGCSANFEEAARPRFALGASAPPRNAERCSSLDSAHTTWGTIAAGAAVASGASGISAIPMKDDTAKTALIATGVGVAVLSAASFFAEQSFGASWARECSGP
jgi:hypothetical protein